MMLAAMMIATAVNSIAVAEDTVRIPVPYIKQVDALCGGAAAAMVLKYWGSNSADMKDFLPLIDHRAGGIANDVLARTLSDRGWTAIQFTGSIESLRQRLRARQPVVVLTHERGERFHYVVAIGYTHNAIVVHDPGRGPSRMISTERFVRSWRRSGSWALLVLPSAATR